MSKQPVGVQGKTIDDYLRKEGDDNEKNNDYKKKANWDENDKAKKDENERAKYYENERSDENDLRRITRLDRFMFHTLVKTVLGNNLLLIC